MPDLPVGLGGEDLFAFLAAQRNDLEAPAIAVEPRIAEVRAALAAQPGCRLSRMSGSGATCFGIFTAAAPAEAAAKALARLGWWTAAAVVN
jgi:4-diphosphocytidyl-2-C-methyl-D-erythritol kinase